MKFKVVLYEHSEGIAAFCPGLQGCVSQGDTRDEALENIQSAIREYLEACWMIFKQGMADDLAENDDLHVVYGEVEVDIEGIEDAEAEEDSGNSLTMPKFPGVNHLRAVRDLEKAGFRVSRVSRQSKHIIMTNDARTIVVPRQNPVDPFTMGDIVRKAGLTVEQFRELL